MAVIKRSQIILIAGLLICLMLVVPVSAVVYRETSPIMTSNTTPAPNIITASSINVPFTDYNAYYAFDHDLTGTYAWAPVDGSVPQWIKINLSVPYAVSQYGIVGRNTNDYMPSAWTFEGSNGTAWTVLDTQTGQTTWVIGARYNYTIANTAKYVNYRLNYTSVISGNSPRICEISLYEIMPIPVASFTTNTTSGVSPLAVQFTDTSTNIPTSWSWKRSNLTWSVGEEFSTDENPVQSFVTGNWSINLTATNAGGSDLSDQITWINVSAPYVPPRSTIQTITHNFGSEITYALVTLTKPGEVSSVSNLTSTTFDLTITNAVSGLAGTNQTVYWCVG